VLSHLAVNQGRKLSATTAIPDRAEGALHAHAYATRRAAARKMS
jgi:hypothetical protein